VSAIDLLKQQHRDVEQLFERIQGSRGEERIALLGALAENLTLHAALEEQFFYPFAREQGVGNIIDESYQDHTEVKQLLSQLLQTKQTDAGLMHLITRLQRMVSEHVGHEERSLLPQVQASADPQELVSLREDMLEAMERWRDGELLKLAEHLESPGAMP
jgi:hemerythrin superfamily protein